MEREKILCLRRENKNKWERRVALTPQSCKELIKKGIKIKVQPSNLRCYTDKQYREVGCEITENIEDCKLIIGVKEVPIDYLYRDKTYMYFSHTIKGQNANMPALKDILEKNIRLIDYECIKEAKSDDPQRLVAFGRYAGLAGAVDFLQGLGEFLLNKKIQTPFINTGYSYMFPSVTDAKESVLKVGENIKIKHLSIDLCPFIIGFTSNGRVSKGAQEIITLLPHEFIEPENISNLFKEGSNPRKDIVYLTIIRSENMYEHKEGKNFDYEDFHKNPKNYKSVFAEKFVPYLSVLFHCMYWNPNADKILSFDESYNLSAEGKFRLLGISDITCDVDGSVDLLVKTTTIENPFYTIDPMTSRIEDDFKKMGGYSMLYHAVDHLPAEFPIDASNHFSEKLTPFIEQILNSDYPSSESTNDLPLEILNACETWNGKLMPKYNYLYKELGKYYSEYQNS